MQLETTVVDAEDEAARLTQRKEILELMVPLRETHGAFRGALCSHLGIYKIPDDLRKKVGLDQGEDEPEAPLPQALD